MNRLHEEGAVLGMLFRLLDILDRKIRNSENY